MAISKAIINNALVLLFFCVLTGCEKPIDSSSYIMRDPVASPDLHKYIIQFEMDSTIVYNTSIFCTMDRDLIEGNEIDMDVTLVSPDGKKYGESIALPLIESGQIKYTKKNGTQIEMEWPYREDVSTESSGVWSIIFNLPNPLQARGVYGVGFSCNGER